VHLPDEATTPRYISRRSSPKILAARSGGYELQTKVRDLEISLWFSLSDYSRNIGPENLVSQAFKGENRKWSRPIFVLLFPIAKKYTNRGFVVSRPDQEGNMGLMKAVEKFEYRPDTSFDLCDLVDSPGNYPVHRRPGAHDPNSGAHD